jgi:hypothetical protein
LHSQTFIVVLTFLSFSPFSFNQISNKFLKNLYKTLNESIIQKYCYTIIKITMSQYSEFNADVSNPQPGYQESQCGPWGVRLNGQIQRTSELNIPFDQLQWEEAKLDGCLPQPCAQYPTWPPPKDVGFVYPSLEKVNQYELLGSGLGPGTEAAPYINRPALTTPQEDYAGKQYSPEEILNSDDCGPQPMEPPALPGMCVSGMPYDATIQSMNTGGVYVGEFGGHFQKERMAGGDCGGDGKEKPYAKLPMPVPAPEKKAPMTVGHGASGANPGAKESKFSESSESSAPMTIQRQLQPDEMTWTTPDGYKQRELLKGKGGVPIVVFEKVGYGGGSGATVRSDCDTAGCSPFRLSQLFPCMGNTLRGIMYDLACWDELPEKRSKLAWVLTRDDRLYYLVALVIFLILLYYGVKLIWKCAFPSPHSSVKAQRFVWVGLLGLLAYWLTPDVEGSDKMQKVVVIVVLAIVVGLLWNAAAKKSYTVHRTSRTPHLRHTPSQMLLKKTFV